MNGNMQITDVAFDAASTTSSARVSDDHSSHCSGKPEPEQIPTVPQVPSDVAKSLSLGKFKSADARIGRVRKITMDGNVQSVEKIFKIIRERNIEFDSDDEDAKGASESDEVQRKDDADKDRYKKLYKKCRKLVERANSTWSHTR